MEASEKRSLKKSILFISTFNKLKNKARLEPLEMSLHRSVHINNSQYQNVKKSSLLLYLDKSSNIPEFYFTKL